MTGEVIDQTDERVLSRHRRLDSEAISIVRRVILIHSSITPLGGQGVRPQVSNIRRKPLEFAGP